MNPASSLRCGSAGHCPKAVVTAALTHSLEREVTLEDHLADLREDGALGVGQVHLPDACVSHAALVLLLGLLHLAGGKGTQSSRQFHSTRQSNCEGTTETLCSGRAVSSSAYPLQRLLRQPPFLLQLLVSGI